VAAEVGGNRQQPGVKALRRDEVRQADQRLDCRLLRGVVHQAPIAQQPPAQRPETPLVASVQHRERQGVSGLHLTHERGVGGVRELRGASRPGLMPPP
jgi:hypothetical protein